MNETDISTALQDALDWAKNKPAVELPNRLTILRGTNPKSSIIGVANIFKSISRDYDYLASMFDPGRLVPQSVGWEVNDFLGTAERLDSLLFFLNQRKAYTSEFKKLVYILQECINSDRYVVDQGDVSKQTTTSQDHATVCRYIKSCSDEYREYAIAFNNYAEQLIEDYIGKEDYSFDGFRYQLKDELIEEELNRRGKRIYEVPSDIERLLVDIANFNIPEDEIGFYSFISDELSEACMYIDDAIELLSKADSISITKGINKTFMKKIKSFVYTFSLRMSAFNLLEQSQKIIQEVNSMGIDVSLRPFIEQFITYLQSYTKIFSKKDLNADELKPLSKALREFTSSLHTNLKD